MTDARWHLRAARQGSRAQEHGTAVPVSRPKHCQPPPRCSTSRDRAPAASSSGAVGETAERAATSKAAPKWLLPLLAALVALTLFLFAGDNDKDNFPDTVDQIGNTQPGNCGANQTATDEGTGDIAPDDQNDCESLGA